MLDEQRTWETQDTRLPAFFFCFPNRFIIANICCFLIKHHIITTHLPAHNSTQIFRCCCCSCSFLFHLAMKGKNFLNWSENNRYVDMYRLVDDNSFQCLNIGIYQRSLLFFFLNLWNSLLLLLFSKLNVNDLVLGYSWFIRIMTNKIAKPHTYL